MTHPSGNAPRISPNGDGSDVFAIQVDATGALSERLDYRGRPRAGTVSAGTVAAGAGAGTSPTVSLVAGSTDAVGTVKVVAGTSPAIGIVATVTFAEPFTKAPFVQLQARDAGAVLGYYATTTTTTLVISVATALTAASTYNIDYALIGGQ